MIKFLLNYLFRIVVLSIIVLAVIWSILLIKNELKTYVHETVETKYESALTKKAIETLGVLIPSKQFKVITTVRFRDTIETLSQYTKDPKKIKQTKNHTSTIEKTGKPTKYNIEKKASPLTLPGMGNIMSSTKRYKLKKNAEKAEINTENHTFSHSEQQVYFNEQHSNVAYRDNAVTFIRLFVIIDPTVLKKNILTQDIIRRYLKDSIPFSFTRGDKLVIKMHSLPKTMTFIETLSHTLKKLIPLWKKVKPILIVISLILLIGFIGYYIAKLILFFNKRDKEKKQKKLAEKSNQIKEKESEIEEGPIDYQKRATDLITEHPKDTAQIIQRWLKND